MERLQVYNRKTNSLGPRYLVEVGFSENWVLDKTTDTAVVRMTMDGKHEFTGDVYRILRYIEDTRGKVYYVEFEPLISTITRLLVGSSEYVQPVNQSYSQTGRR